MPDILRALDQSPLTIIIDEVDKARQTTDSNHSWTRAVLDEIFALLDGGERLQDFRPSATALSNLRRSWILAAGAFQDLYRKELGGEEIVFPEEIEKLEPMTYDRIVETGWLPDELLNRLAGDLVEVRPPGVEEFSQVMEAIEADAGLTVAAEVRKKRAAAAACSFRGFRVIETYALQCAKKAIERPDSQSR